MKFRTTKQIINESLNGRDTWFISDEVWVGLESLKKEIKKHVYCPFPDGTCMISGGNCFHTLLDLCNSSEQKESSPVHNQKKCTCPRPEPRLPEELLNNCCGRCGGVL